MNTNKGMRRTLGIPLTVVGLSVLGFVVPGLAGCGGTESSMELDLAKSEQSLVEEEVNVEEDTSSWVPVRVPLTTDIQGMLDSFELTPEQENEFEALVTAYIDQGGGGIEPDEETIRLLKNLYVSNLATQQMEYQDIRIRLDVITVDMAIMMGLLEEMVDFLFNVASCDLGGSMVETVLPSGVVVRAFYDDKGNRTSIHYYGPNGTTSIYTDTKDGEQRWVWVFRSKDDKEDDDGSSSSSSSSSGGGSVWKRLWNLVTGGDDEKEEEEEGEEPSSIAEWTGPESDGTFGIVQMMLEGRLLYSDEALTIYRDLRAGQLTQEEAVQQLNQNLVEQYGLTEGYQLIKEVVIQ